MASFRSPLAFPSLEFDKDWIEAAMRMEQRDSQHNRMGAPINEEDIEETLHTRTHHDLDQEVVNGPIIRENQLLVLHASAGLDGGADLKV
ncbi:hypothetical protein MMC14_001943 [Varicellaria rhodocarpa]|nr:hypothetical protein [Varicellaria rhodocarpa]